MGSVGISPDLGRRELGLTEECGLLDDCLRCGGLEIGQVAVLGECEFDGASEEGDEDCARVDARSWRGVVAAMSGPSRRILPRIVAIRAIASMRELWRRIPNLILRAN